MSASASRGPVTARAALLHNAGALAKPSLHCACEEGEQGMSDDEPIVAQKGPYQVELVEGRTYSWCRCGRSQRQPFCDGSHRGTSFEPVRFVAQTSGIVNLCGCKSTDDPPYCDGSHNLL